LNHLVGADEHYRWCGQEGGLRQSLKQCFRSQQVGRSEALGKAERLSTAARRIARSSIFRVWSLGIPTVPKRSISSAGLVSASAKTLITASWISWAGSRQPWDWSVPASVIRAVET